MSRERFLAATNWVNVQALPATKKYRCGVCDALVASERGFATNQPQAYFITICPMCLRPTHWEDGKQYPGVAFGSPVQHLPKDIESLYDEARVCCSSSAHTAAVLLLRKLLMNVAVHRGAPEGQSFISYVAYLATQGYVPPDGKVWVDHIRKKGNEANHEITLMEQADAEDLVTFSEMLLKFIYEFPKRVPQPKPPAP
jgi:hypothetical protein